MRAFFFDGLFFIKPREVGWTYGTQGIIHQTLFGFFFWIGITFNIFLLVCIGHACHLCRLRCQTWPPRIPCSLLLKEAELLGAVAYQQVFGLLIVVEHHAVRLAANAGLLVSAKGCVGRIGMVAVDPHAARLDGTT